MQEIYDVAVIGCGVVGAAAAYELSRYELGLVVLEKENDVSCATSKANSGILHAGYDPEPGTLMARLNVEGARLAAELCQRLEVPYRACGSLVVAFSDEERATLEALLARGVQNGVRGLALWDADTLRTREPALSEAAVAALYAPTAAIVNPWEYTLALAETAVRNGARLLTESPVESITREPDGYTLHTPRGVVRARYVVNAAGVHADEVHNRIAAPSFHIRPARGEYYLLDKSEGDVVSHVVFPCPSALGKGVLVAPTVHGNLIVGPNNEPVTDGEDSATTADGLREVAASARRSVPALRLERNIRSFAGVRAVSDRDDFIIEPAAPGFIDLAGIKSPGLTAAPAIAVEAVRLLAREGLTLTARPDFIDTRRHVRFAELSHDERRALVAENPAYGRVICRCETVTEGEILDALQSPIPPVSIDGVKRRCGTGLGRCQGGFCGPRVLELLAAHSGRAPTDIPQDRAGSLLLTGETKQGGCNHA